MNPITIISLIVSCIMMMVGVSTFIITQARNQKTDIEKENSIKDEMKSSLLELNLLTQNINATTNDIKADVKTLTGNVNDINTRVVLLEREQKEMWRRIGEVKEKNHV